jgi:hypothetical protein
VLISGQVGDQIRQKVIIAEMVEFASGVYLYG